MDSKTCTKCGEFKPLDEFYNNVKGPLGKNWACGECHRIAARKHSREHHKANPGVYRASRLRHLYGLTPEKYDELLASQDGKCAICRTECVSGLRLAVDHDHTCCPGAKTCGNCIRGLLCINCNQAIGKFKDNTELLSRAIDYLSQERKCQV